jgi:rSAM/selenodomain-associated transferase 1
MDSIMQRLMLFAKRPRLGEVKTRLVPPLSTELALQLYRAFLSDQIRFLGTFADRCTLELCVDERWAPDPELGPTPPTLAIREQGPGDLGERLLRAFRRSFRAGSHATVVLGVDSPTVPRDHVARALDHLESGASAVVAPAEDGGYVLLGLREPREELFRDVPWGGPQVMAVTRRRAARRALPLVELESWYDVDDATGLARLRAELAATASRHRAPTTATLLDRLDYPGRTVL